MKAKIKSNSQCLLLAIAYFLNVCGHSNAHDFSFEKSFQEKLFYFHAFPFMLIRQKAILCSELHSSPLFLKLFYFHAFPMLIRRKAVLCSELHSSPLFLKLFYFHAFPMLIRRKAVLCSELHSSPLFLKLSIGRHGRYLVDGILFVVEACNYFL